MTDLASSAERAPGQATVAQRRGAASVFRSLLAAVIAAGAPSAWSACSVNTSSVDFGLYDPFAGSDADGTGNIAVTCDAGTPYAISLSPGGGTVALRRMSNGAYVLDYNLYTDASRHIVWGDGVGATATVGGAGTGSATNAPVYGRIPARQNARVGVYSDNIVVTVTF